MAQRSIETPCGQRCRVLSLGPRWLRTQDSPKGRKLLPHFGRWQIDGADLQPPEQLLQTCTTNASAAVNPGRENVVDQAKMQRALVEEQLWQQNTTCKAAGAWGNNIKIHMAQTTRTHLDVN